MLEELDVVASGTNWSLERWMTGGLSLVVHRPTDFRASPRQVEVVLPEPFLDELFRQKGKVREKIPAGTTMPPREKDPVPPRDGSFQEALRWACEEPTLVKALAWICLWECDRAVRQALRNDAARREGRDHPPTSHGGLYETCFEFALGRTLERWESGPTSPEPRAPSDRRHGLPLRASEWKDPEVRAKFDPELHPLLDQLAEALEGVERRSGRDRREEG